MPQSPLTLTKKYILGLFNNDYPEKIEDCNKKFILHCHKMEKLDYCKKENYNIPLNCMERKLKGNCQNYDEYHKLVEKIHGYCLKKSYCDLEHIFNLDFWNKVKVFDIQVKFLIILAVENLRKQSKYHEAKKSTS